MKIKFWILAFLCFGTSLAYSQSDAKTKVSRVFMEEARCMSLAHQLVRYGIQHESSLSIIQAIDLYQSYGIHAAKGPAPVDNNANAISSEYSLDMDSLCKYAALFADGDENLIALLDSYKVGNTRGPKNGPSVFYGKKLEAYESATWTFNLNADEPVYIYVGGDGGTDLDVYAYDSDHNLVEKDTNFGDDCLIIFTPKTSDVFSIVVKNEGDFYNVYDFTIK